MKKFCLLILAPLLIQSPLAHALKVNIVAARKYSPTDLDKLNRAVVAAEMVLNSEEFKEKILNFSYNGIQEFVQNNGLSNQQVYDTIMNGAEINPKPTDVDHEMDVELELYKPKWYQSKKVIGYTEPGFATVFVNQNYFRPAAISDVADNMVHEWCHKLGFDHDFKSTPRRPYSVPYAVGYIVDDIIAAHGW